jgi:copper binding plastocyanin/azurin family protein
LTALRQAIPIASVLILLGLVILLIPPSLHLVPNVSASNRTITLIANAIGWNYTTGRNPPITVVQGDNVTVKLSSTDTMHNFLVDVDNDLYDNSDCRSIDPCSADFSTSAGTSYTFPVNFAPGNYTYYCTFHPGNMVGRFIVQGFTIASNPASLTLVHGMSAASTITLTNHNGFSGIIGLTASSYPNGPVISLKPATVTMSSTTPSATSIVTVNATLSTLAGSYVIAVNATSGSSTQVATLAVTLTGPDFSIGASWTSIEVAPGSTGTGTSTITLSSINGFSGTVNLTAEGVSSWYTVSLNPASVALSSGGTGSSTVTISVPVPMNWTLPNNCFHCRPQFSDIFNVTATSGSLTHFRSTGFTANVHLSSGSSRSAFANLPMIALVGSVVATIAVAGAAGYLMIRRRVTTDQNNHSVSCVAQYSMGLVRRLKPVHFIV